MSTIEPNLEKLQYIFDNDSVGMAVCNVEDNTIEMLNPAFARIYGYEFNELIGVSPEEVFSQKSMLHLEEYGKTISSAVDDGYFEMTHIRKNGSFVDVFVHITVIKDENGAVKHRIINIIDITEHKKDEDLLAQKESRLADALKIAKIGFWAVEFPGLRLSWSDEIFRIFEIDQDVFQPSYDYFLNATHPEDRVFIDTTFADSLKNKAPYDIEHRILMKDGRLKYVHGRGETIYNAAGNPIRSIGTVQDITERKSIEKKIAHMAHHDILTGLPNRALAEERAVQIMAHAKRSGSKAAFLFIDLDEFKVINDTLGHFTGDSMLKSVASRLEECVRESDILSRQGGDEFLVILSDIKEHDVIVSIAKKILAELEKTVEINTHTLSLSGSIGIALYPEHGETFESLFQSADTAMYRIKSLGKNSYCFYAEQMKYDLIEEFKLKNDLKNAIQNNEFILFYQPQIDLAQNCIVGAEALIRWQHPQRGMVLPMSFISVAEGSGLIVQIGQWVIEEACRQAAIWQKEGKEIIIAINISAVQFKRGNLESVVKNALTSSGLNPKLLELELTESILIDDMENTLKTVQILKGLGIQLSIDDFGTGYSSLAYLKRFAVDKLKIDQSFVRGILEDPDDAVIVKTIIQMAKNLNLKTIAEGVENGEVLAVINSYGCDEVQGYHFAKPMSSSAFENYCHQFRKHE